MHTSSDAAYPTLRPQLYIKTGQHTELQSPLSKSFTSLNVDNYIIFAFSLFLFFKSCASYWFRYFFHMKRNHKPDFLLRSTSVTDFLKILKEVLTYNSNFNILGSASRSRLCLVLLCFWILIWSHISYPSTLRYQKFGIQVWTG